MSSRGSRREWRARLRDQGGEWEDKGRVVSGSLAPEWAMRTEPFCGLDPSRGLPPVSLTPFEGDTNVRTLRLRKFPRWPKVVRGARVRPDPLGCHNLSGQQEHLRVARPCPADSGQPPCCGRLGANVRSAENSLHGPTHGPPPLPTSRTSAEHLLPSSDPHRLLAAAPSPQFPFRFAPGVGHFGGFGKYLMTCIYQYHSE